MRQTYEERVENYRIECQHRLERVQAESEQYRVQFDTLKRKLRNGSFVASDLQAKLLLYTFREMTATCSAAVNYSSENLLDEMAANQAVM